MMRQGKKWRLISNSRFNRNRSRLDYPRRIPPPLPRGSDGPEGRQNRILPPRPQTLIIHPSSFIIKSAKSPYNPESSPQLLHLPPFLHLRRTPHPQYHLPPFFGSSPSASTATSASPKWSPKLKAGSATSTPKPTT